MPRLTRAETRADTRGKLLDAGRHVFAAKGLHHATVEEIAERAGFTRGAFYANFADKADLLMTIVEGQRAEAFAAMVSVVGGADDGDKMPRAQAWYEGMTAHPLDHAVTELMTKVVEDPALRARMARQREADRQAIVTVVRGYCDSAGIELPIAVEHFAAICLAIGDGLGAQRHLDAGAVPVDLFSRAMLWLWDGVWAGHSPVP